MYIIQNWNIVKKLVKKVIKKVFAQESHDIINSQNTRVFGGKG